MYEVSFPGLSIYDLKIDRIAFELFGFSVYWYGLLIAAAIIVCLYLASRQAPTYNIKSDDILDTFILIIPMMILFARLYYVFFRWEYYAQDWRRIIDISHGGLAFYGGVFGGFLAIVLSARYKKIPLARLVDFLAVYVPLGQAIGRWGNFFNQEAFGTNTRLPWGMYSNQTEAYLRSLGGGHDPTAPVHPTFFYEFIGNLILFAILYRLRKTNKVPYRITLYYFLGYGILRFFVEMIRTDPLYIPGTALRISLLTSAVLAIGSIAFLAWLRQKQQRDEMEAALRSDPPPAKMPYENQDEGTLPDESLSAETKKTESDESESDFVVLDSDHGRKREIDSDHDENGSDA